MYQAMQQFVLGDVWDFNPLPPAPAAAIALPQQIVVLEKPIGFSSYPKAGQRIGMLNKAS